MFDLLRDDEQGRKGEKEGRVGDNEGKRRRKKGRMEVKKEGEEGMARKEGKVGEKRSKRIKKGRGEGMNEEDGNLILVLDRREIFCQFSVSCCK